MKEYGFIPIDALRKEPIPRIMNLVKAIERRYRRESKEAEKLKRRPRKR